MPGGKPRQGQRLGARATASAVLPQWHHTDLGGVNAEHALPWQQVGRLPVAKRQGADVDQLLEGLQHKQQQQGNGRGPSTNHPRMGGKRVLLLVSPAFHRTSSPMPPGQQKATCS